MVLPCEICLTGRYHRRIHRTINLINIDKVLEFQQVLALYFYWKI